MATNSDKLKMLGQYDTKTEPDPKLIKKGKNTQFNFRAGRYHHRGSGQGWLGTRRVNLFVFTMFPKWSTFKINFLKYHLTP